MAQEKIKIYFAGECPTGVGSALVPFFKMAGSLNFTPSHNPMDYAGLKFNPADGGPAPPELTDVIQVRISWDSVAECGHTNKRLRLDYARVYTTSVRLGHGCARYLADTNGSTGIH